MKNKNIDILYVTSALFPYGQAYSTRIIGFSKLFSFLGYNVHVIAGSTYKQNIKRYSVQQYEDFTYEIVGKHTRFYRFIKNKYNILRAVKKHICQNNISYIVVAASDRNLYFKLKRLCEKNSIALILEICEWYDITSFKLRLFDPRYIFLGSCMNKFFFSADGIIAISRLLENHFISKKKHVIRIPTILDIKKESFSAQTSNKRIRLIHAGSVGGKKEIFRSIFIALQNFKDSKIFEYYIYGGTYDQILENIAYDKKLIDSLDGTVYIMGNIPQYEVSAAYMQADYSIIIRPDRNSSHAGFPTKLAESMVTGTPVIANNTGDISLYLKDGENGFLLESDSPEEIEKVFNRILTLSQEQKEQMRKNAHDNYYILKKEICGQPIYFPGTLVDLCNNIVACKYNNKRENYSYII